jgi:hypothetical protein
MKKKLLMLRIFLLLSLCWLSHSHVIVYSFKTLDPATGDISKPVKEILETLELPTTLSAPETLALLQEKYGRKENQERYELSQNQQIDRKKDKLFNSFTKLGMTKATLPSQKNYDFIIILGSTIENMRDRVAFLLYLLKEKMISLKPTTQLLFLAGDRELFPHETILESKKHSFRPNWAPPSADKLPKTEAEAALPVLDQLVPNSSLRNRIKVLLTPKRYDASTKQWLRPHTGNNIETLIEHIGNISKRKRLLFISSNPGVAYQNAVISREFLDRSLLDKIEVETVGPIATQNISIVEVDNLKNTLHRELEVWKRLQKKS